ncbi:MAG TPA: hypothetical protein VG273_11135 [Bryobacteraceae bacterium]|jgi:hypothetical protein|nr:hypothetical protein [Bryobacteraceae bacterium]
MKKSAAINISFLASVAAAISACGSSPVHIHLNASGQCVSEVTGQLVNQSYCTPGGGGGGYFGGTRYVYVPGESAITTRGVFGGTAESATAAASGDSAGGHGAGGDGAGGHGAGGGGE